MPRALYASWTSSPLILECQAVDQFEACSENAIMLSARMPAPPDAADLDAVIEESHHTLDAVFRVPLSIASLEAGLPPGEGGANAVNRHSQCGHPYLRAAAIPLDLRTVRRRQS